jgi:hypothetical protein
MDYYEISRRKMRKDEMVQMLIMYEEDPANAEVVERRNDSGLTLMNSKRTSIWVSM